MRLREWYLQKCYLATKIQSIWRGAITRHVQRTVLMWENVNVVLLQRNFRGYKGRMLATHTQHSLAALHIQCMYRTYTSRKYLLYLYYSKYAIHIQCRFRRNLAYRFTRGKKKQESGAATQLQALFRGTLGRERVIALLQERERLNKQVVMQMLQVENEWALEHVELLTRRLERFGYNDEYVLW